MTHNCKGYFSWVSSHKLISSQNDHDSNYADIGTVQKL